MSLDAYFAAQPHEWHPVFAAVKAAIEESGPVAVEAVSVGILFKRERTFAELRPKKGRLVLSILLSRRVEDPRITRVVSAGGRRIAHFVDLRTAGDVDEVVRAWVAEGYAASPV
jgi:Domain of unknown function (DUF5655)